MRHDASGVEHDDEEETERGDGARMRVMWRGTLLPQVSVHHEIEGDRPADHVASVTRRFLRIIVGVEELARVLCAASGPARFLGAAVGPKAGGWDRCARFQLLSADCVCHLWVQRGHACDRLEGHRRGLQGRDDRNCGDAPRRRASDEGWRAHAHRAVEEIPLEFVSVVVGQAGKGAADSSGENEHPSHHRALRTAGRVQFSRASSLTIGGAMNLGVAKLL